MPVFAVDELSTFRETFCGVAVGADELSVDVVDTVGELLHFLVFFPSEDIFDVCGASHVDAIEKEFGISRCRSSLFLWSYPA